MTAIAVLDDDPDMLAQIESLLVGTGRSCQTFANAKALLRASTEAQFDLFILDWNLPDLSGLGVVEWIRGTIGASPAVLLLTSRTSEEDIVTGLKAGADDFITKPFPKNVLLARIEALLRRLPASTSNSHIERFGIYEFNSNQLSVRLNEEPIALTPKEFQLSLLLFRNLHRAVARNFLFEALWGRNADLPSRTLDSHVSKIRRKLILRPENGYVLMPVYGYGYRLEQVQDAP